MASWDSESYTSADYSGKEKINKYITDREEARSTAGSKPGIDLGAIQTFEGESFVGLNVSGVDTICRAIETYVNNILEHLNGITVDTETSSAFKSSDGSVESAVQGYVANIKEYCQNLCSSLMAYCDKMYAVKEAYISNLESLTQTINDETGSTEKGSKFTTSSYNSGGAAV